MELSRRAASPKAERGAATSLCLPFAFVGLHDDDEQEEDSTRKDSAAKGTNLGVERGLARDEGRDRQTENEWGAGDGGRRRHASTVDVICKIGDSFIQLTRPGG